MKNSMRFIVLSLFVLCFAVGAFSQSSTTGSIEGQVTDPQGKVVSGATVTVTSPNLITAQTAQTDDQGRFRISNLPPGRYTVTIAPTAGFAETVKSDVEVNLSRTSTADVQVKISGSTAEVTVTDVSGAAIDQSQNTTGTNVSTEQFSNFPTARTVQGLYTIAPTVARSGLRDASGRDRDPSVGGSSGPENNYILDGVNTTDPAFGGSGANLPFEFVQEVEIKTGAFGAEYGRATGGIFNVITKSGGNEVRGDAFGYFTTKSMVRKTTVFPGIGAAPSGFSEIDAGIDIGGPIKKDKLWFFGAFNPQRRTNTFLTQEFRIPVENKLTTPFYAGKLTFGINANHTFTFSTFGDFTKQEGFLFRVNARIPDSGFGADLNSFRGTIQTGGHNYTARLNSTFNPNFIGEFMLGMHFQRANTIPDPTVANQSLNFDTFAVVAGNTVRPVITPGIAVAGGIQGAFVDGRGGRLTRNYTRSGFGLVSNQDRNRWEFAARLQNIWGKHTVKYGFEWNKNIYKILTTSSGPARNFADPFGEEVGAAHPSTTMPGGVRITNRFGVCTAVSATTIQCPTSGLTNRLAPIVTAGFGPAGITTVTTNTALTDAQLNVNPILVLNAVRVRDFFLNTGGGSTSTNVESFYVQDDVKVTRNFQLNLGLRWDYQEAKGTRSSYLKLHKFFHNVQPRAGFSWDPSGRGKGKVFFNYAKYIETPLPLDVNVRAGGDDIQLDRNINANRYGAPPGSSIVAGTASGLGCLGCDATPIDAGIRPQSVEEYTTGFEYEVVKDLAFGARGIYRAQANVIEDGSFDDGTTYFLFNPGRRGDGETTEDKACLGVGGAPKPQCFGYARRYYRALEFTATKRFSNHYQFIASYVFSSLIGNYEGLFRNDNGQSDPNITSLFDLPDLLNGLYGRLPNDRPHQFKMNASYETPWKLMVSSNFYIQSGIPFSDLIPHPVYGENEGFGHPRGTAPIPANAPGGIKAGGSRTPTTYQLDLGAYYPIKFGEKRQLRFQADWFNVTNAQRAVRLDETVRVSNGIPGAGEGRFLNPFFGTGSVFQFPSTLRLGVKFSF
jgi:outer membrane receptor protein involved in Fe transport